MEIRKVNIDGYEIIVYQEGSLEIENKFYYYTNNGKTYIGSNMSLDEFVEKLRTGYFERI